MCKELFYDDDPSLPPLSLSLLQRLVKAAEEAHEQHEEDPDLQVCLRPGISCGFPSALGPLR